MFTKTTIIVLMASMVAIAVAQQFFNQQPPNMGGAIGCVVTGKKLYSHGNYIRDLAEDEFKELKKYKKELTAFKKKIDEAFANAENLERTNATIPPMPLRPAMPAFCSKSDTTMYIFTGCTVQNYKVYVAGKYARDLTTKEKKQLDIFAKQIADKPTPAGNGTAPAPPAKQINLDFCTEF
uniref:Pepsin-I3 domain-containing protein n=1 Tax=Panagrellus redivivus TaxID=6233 RepID=A0A7E4VKX4_PANRE